MIASIFYRKFIMFSDVKNLDIILSPVTIEEYLWKVARSVWNSEQYNLFLISGLFTQSSNVWRMMNMFESIIWYLIVVSIFTIAFYLTLKQIHQDKISFYKRGN